MIFYKDARVIQLWKDTLLTNCAGSTENTYGRKWIGRPETGRKCLQYLCLTNKLYPENLCNSHFNKKWSKPIKKLGKDLAFYNGRHTKCKLAHENYWTSLVFRKMYNKTIMRYHYIHPVAVYSSWDSYLSGSLCTCGFFLFCYIPPLYCPLFCLAVFDYLGCFPSCVSLLCLFYFLLTSSVFQENKYNWVILYCMAQLICLSTSLSSGLLIDMCLEG